MSKATTNSSSAQPKRARSRQRFEDKRERILDAATVLLNERGTKGMTLQNVAGAVGLNTTSITYYFARKELLAAAIFEQTLTQLEQMVIAAASAPTPQARVERLLGLSVQQHAEAARGAGRPLASLSDLRTLEDTIRAPLIKHYQALFRRVRGFYGPPRDDLHKALLTARTHMLLEVVFWLRVWIHEHAIVDFPNVLRRLLDILAHGIAKPGAAWAPQILPSVDPEEERHDGAANFMRAATRLINETGYREASVDRIAAKLNVTKGSFYHHLDAKDELVVECFRRSYRRVSQVQTLAEAAGGDHWRRLASAMATLLNIQFEGEFPLLRTTALQALPPPLRANVVARSNRLAHRFAGELVDAMAEGSVRIIDPSIASQLIMATLNTANDLRKWASRLPREQAIALYASTLVDGIFNDRVLETPAPVEVERRRRSRTSADAT